MLGAWMNGDSQGNEDKDPILNDKTHTNSTGKVDNYESPIKGNDAALNDFNKLKPTNVRQYPNGTIVGELPDGTTINIHPSTFIGGVPTVEIYNPNTGRSIKIRY